MSLVCSDGDLVLMDAGCEYHGYASDITRTWPINGKFTEAQRQLYDVVHRVQSACIRVIVLFPSQIWLNIVADGWCCVACTTRNYFK